MIPVIRNRQEVVLQNKTYLINELSIGDIFCLYPLVKDISDKVCFEELFAKLIEMPSTVEYVINCSLQTLLQSVPSELKNVYESFLEVNKLLFHKSASTISSQDSFIVCLFDLCCYLIEAGHSNVLNYGYSFFIRAINNYEQNKNKKIEEYAVAARNAYHANNKEWKTYTRSLGVRHA